MVRTLKTFQAPTPRSKWKELRREEIGAHEAEVRVSFAFLRMRELLLSPGSDSQAGIKVSGGKPTV